MARTTSNAIEEESDREVIAFQPAHNDMPTAGHIPSKDLLFDMRNTVEGKMYVAKETNRMLWERVLLVFLLNILFGSILLWMIVESPPVMEMILAVALSFFATLGLVWTLGILPRKWHEQKTRLPLLDSDGIFELDKSGIEVVRFPFDNIAVAYECPGDPAVWIVLKKPTEKGIRFAYWIKKKIIDPRRFLEILSGIGVRVDREEVVTSDTLEGWRKGYPLVE